MLYQIKVKQTRKSQQRLWFSDHFHDLFIWLDTDNQPLAFQFCYDKSDNEHAVLWHHQTGYSHQRVDSGEPTNGRYKQSPILIANGQPEQASIAANFRRISANIDPTLAAFVYKKLLDYPN